MPATQPPSEEKEYGVVQAEEAAAQQTAAIPPLEETVFENVAPPENVQNVQNVQNVPTEQKPNMWRIPANYEGILGQEHKPALQRQEDIGYLWAALAVDPNSHPIVRQIAQALMGRDDRGQG